MNRLELAVKRLDILVADDMEAMRTMVGSCLKEIGAEKIHYAVNGKQAWSELGYKNIDLIICDWDMPQASGLDLLKKIRATSDYAHIPFLMLTASTEKSKVVDAIEAGATDYLAKPFQPRELEYRVLKLLRKVKMG